jgi:putative DNA primase/helicase
MSISNGSRQRPSFAEVEEKFRAALRLHGISFSGEFKPDGEWQHFRADGDKHGKKGWYKVFYDDWPAGSFGHFSRIDGSQKFNYYGDDAEMSPAERAAVRAKQHGKAQKRAKLDTAKSERNFSRIRAQWKAAGEVVQHGYLTRKRVGAYGLRQVSTWVKAYQVADAGPWLKARLPHALLVPMQDATGAVVGLQAIFDRKHDCLADGTGGDKDFAPGSKLKGGFHVIGDVDAAERIVIAEGYATGATIHNAFDRRLAVVIAFTAGNLLAVAKIIRAQHPGGAIIIAGDDDRWHADPKIINAGRTKAVAAAAAVRGVAAVVDVSALAPAIGATDYNDVACHHSGGLAEVRRQIEVAIAAEMAASKFHQNETAAEPPPDFHDRAPPRRRVELALPRHPLPVRNGNSAGRMVKRFTAAYMNRVARHRAAMEWKERRRQELLEELNDPDPDKTTLSRVGNRAHAEARREFGKKAMRPPRYQLVASAGIGKTAAVRNQYRTRPEFWSLHINVYVPTIKLARQFAADVNDNRPAGMPEAVVIVGRDRADDGAAPACDRSAIIAKAQVKVASVYKSFCDDGEGLQCPFYAECRYIDQFADHSPRIRIFAHNHLYLPKPEGLKLPAPDLVVVDESVVDKFGTTARIDPDVLGDPSIYRDEDGTPHPDAEVFAALGKRIAEAVTSGGYVIDEVKKYDEERFGHITVMERLIKKNSAIAVLRAAATAAGGERSNFGIKPTDDDEVAEKKLEQALENPAVGVPVLLRHIRRDLLNHRTTSLAVEFQAEDKKEETLARILCHYRRRISAFDTKTPLLLIDADGILEINRLIYGGRIPLRSVTIRAKRIGRFIQLRDATYPKVTLLGPKKDPKKVQRDEHTRARQVKRADELRAKIMEFVRRLHSDGKKVFVVTNMEVRQKITGEGKRPPMFHELAPGFEITHFGTIRGSNRWEDFDVVAVLGREQVPPDKVLIQARQLYGDSDTVFDIPSPLQYLRASRPYSSRSGDVAEIDAFRDPRLQALIELTRERGTGQAIDRLRLMYEKPCRSPEIYLLCDIPIEGVVPDVLDSMNRIADGGSRIENAIARGMVTTNAEVMHAEYGDLYETPRAAKDDIQRSRPILSQVLENKERTQDANNIYSISKLRPFLENKDLGDNWRRGAFRVRADDRWGPRHSGLGYSPSMVRRPDINIARHLRLPHIDRLEFRGHAAEALQRARARDESMGSCWSLSPHSDAERKKLDSRTQAGQHAIIAEFFKTHPTRVACRSTVDGAVVHVWRDHTGKPIPPPIDAPPPPAPPAPTRGNLFHRRNPRLVRFSEPDGEGHRIVAWYQPNGSEVSGPAGDLDEVGEAVDAEHQAAVAVMSDSEIESALMARSHGAPPEAVAAFAARVRVMAAGSPQASIAIFMRDRRWRYRSRSVPSEAAE